VRKAPGFVPPGMRNFLDSSVATWSVEGWPDA
jgi:hypothetical protein